MAAGGRGVGHEGSAAGRVRLSTRVIGRPTCPGAPSGPGVPGELAGQALLVGLGLQFAVPLAGELGTGRP
jgi:hypothetical protein